MGQLFKRTTSHQTEKQSETDTKQATTLKALQKAVLALSTQVAQAANTTTDKGASK